MSRIGAADAGGVQRPALSAADLEARGWLRERIEAAGLVEISVETIFIPFTDYALCRQANFLDRVEAQAQALVARVITPTEL